MECTGNSKKNLINEKVRRRNNSTEVTSWEYVFELLKSLDYWCEQRNYLIHSAEGTSRQRMIQLFNQVKSHNPDVCHPDNILKNMADILLRGDLKIIKDEHRRFVDGNEYYIYSTVKDWVIEIINTEGLK